ncbi:hypothetical protein KAR91_27140 [Candidatus Pacearchaeota archaeon]|nr:hypothetical protein [Candidatus Pacearchaeota archaeon]
MTIGRELRDEQKAMVASNEPLKRYGTIIAKISETTYQVEDQQLRRRLVEAQSLWKKGDTVTIMNNRIVGRARVFKQPTEYIL